MKKQVEKMKSLSISEFLKLKIKTTIMITYLKIKENVFFIYEYIFFCSGIIGSMYFLEISPKININIGSIISFIFLINFWFFALLVWIRIIFRLLKRKSE